MNLAEKVKREFTDLPEGWIVLLETSADNAVKTSLLALKILTKKGLRGIVLSASRPYANLLALYDKNGIDTSKLFFLDCVSCSRKGAKRQNENVVFLEGVSALTEISVGLSKTLRKVNGRKFVFIDSLTTMLIYNKPGIFARFLHSVLTKMRINGISGLLIALENETNPEVRAEIAQLCDKVIKI